MANNSCCSKLRFISSKTRYLYVDVSYTQKLPRLNFISVFMTLLIPCIMKAYCDTVATLIYAHFVVVFVRVVLAGVSPFTYLNIL